MYALRLFVFAVVALGFLFYLALAPIFAMPLYNQLLFQPSGYPDGHYDVESVAGVRRQDVFFPTTGGVKLHGWYFKHDKPVKTVLINHGNGGNLTYRLDIAQRMLEAGCSVFVYDYQGYGLSEGTPSLRGVCADAISAYKYVHEDLNIPANQIVLLGESLGTGVTCEVLPSCPCSGIILNASFYSLESVSREHLGFLNIYPSWMFPTPSLNSAAALIKTHPPLLMMHGVDDALCFVDQAKSLFKVARGPKSLVLLAGAEHNYLAAHPNYGPAVTTFLASLGGAKPHAVSHIATVRQ